MIYNILNGDSLAYSFPDTKIEGDVIVVREALIDGDFRRLVFPGLQLKSLQIQDLKAF